MNLGQKIIKKTENPELDNLILSLLNSNPDKRITWKQYFEHSFFKNRKDRTESISEKKPENIKEIITRIKVNKNEENKPIFKFEEKSRYIKVILLGSQGVGKTELIRQFAYEEFEKISILFCKNFEFPEFGISLKFNIWNINSQKGYKKLILNFLEDAKVIIFIYDITNRKSFEEVKFFWYSLYMNSYYNTKPILAVLANKDELYYNEQVSKEEGKSFADEIGLFFN
jgi:serine/threonine protein kinase